MTRGARTWCAIGLWGLLLAACSVLLARKVELGSDLKLFLPRAATPAERILLEEVEDGPGTRLMLVALSGATPGRLAQASQQLADTLRRDARFARVENGSLYTDARLETLVTRYRYLLTPADPDLSAAGLRRALGERLKELSSPAGSIAQEWLLRDPTGELQNLLAAWQGAATPQLIDGVWFDRAGRRALLIAQTAAPGFDAGRQRDAVAALRQALHTAAPDEALRLDITGSGAFTALLEQQVRRDVTMLGAAEGIASFCFLFAVLWSLRHVVLGSLTLATAGVAALLAVSLLFDSVHGITFAFGFTLLGVAMDYPVHLALHLRRGHSAVATGREVWPTLRLSIATTCIAYLALAFAGFTGLAQLGVFTASGLLATALAIRGPMPRLLDPEAARAMPRWVERVQRAPRVRWLAGAVIPPALLFLAFSPQPLWDNNLSGLTPVPQALQNLDTELRRELGAADLRYVIAVRAGNPERSLERDEQLRPALQAWVDTGLIDGFEQPSQLLPSVARQTARLNALPSRAHLQAELRAASADLPFRDDVFDAFLDDIDSTRGLAALRPQDLRGTSLAARLDAVLFDTEQESVALTTLSNVHDAQGLARATAGLGGDVLLLDLKQISEDLVERFRNRALIALGGALAVIAALMLAQLTLRAALAVLLPVLATLSLEVAVLNACGVQLTLFHVVSLLLVGGLCFDYGLFFNRSETSDEESLRTRFAVMCCWLSTTGAFALLLISQLPVLRAIGSTVPLGVTLGFGIALLTRHDTRRRPS